MTRCEDVRRASQMYVDNELGAAEELDVEAHLLDCEECAAEYDSLRAVVDTVRGSKPLCVPPGRLQRRLALMVERASRKARGPRRLVLYAEAAAVVVVLWAGSQFMTRSTTFNVFAADAHLRYASGRLPLDIASDQPRLVSRWLESRIPFKLSVPDYPSDSREPKAYTLAGARLMQYDGGDVAYLAYTMKDRPVSLLVSSSATVQPAGNEAMRSGNLVFHFSVAKGLKLITWRDRDLVYALVSDVQVGKADSCVVCHGSVTERSRFESMSPRVRKE